MVRWGHLAIAGAAGNGGRGRGGADSARQRLAGGDAPLLRLANPEPIPAEQLDAARIGVPEIDADHAKVFAHYHAYVRALGRDTDPHALALAMHAFIHQVRRHFAREERLMAEVGYPDRVHHRTMHRHLLHDAEDFLARLVVDPGRDELVTVTRFLERWFMDHITTQDRKIGEFLADRAWPH